MLGVVTVWYLSIKLCWAHCLLTLPEQALKYSLTGRQTVLSEWHSFGRVDAKRPVNQCLTSVNSLCQLQTGFPGLQLTPVYTISPPVFGPDGIKCTNAKLSGLVSIARAIPRQYPHELHSSIDRGSTTSGWQRTLAKTVCRQARTKCPSPKNAALVARLRHNAVQVAAQAA